MKIKKVFKIIMMFSLILIGIFIFPNTSKAYIKVSDYISINDTYNYDNLNDLSFNEVKFKIKPEYNLFGLEGKVNNKSDFILPYIMKVEFYDKDNKLLITSDFNNKISSLDTNDFVNPVSIDKILNGTLDDIAKYRIAIFTGNNCNDFQDKLSIKDMIITLELNENGESVNNSIMPKDIKKDEIKDNDLVKKLEAYDVKINQMYVDVVVNKNNTYKFTFNLKVEFNKPTDTFSWFIPSKTKLNRNNEESTIRNIKSYDISSNKDFELIKNKDNKEIKINNSGNNFEKEEDIKIEYTINIGKDPLKNIDELYIRLNYDICKYPIQKIILQIHMPFKFDSSTLMFTYGDNYLPNNDLVNYEVKDNEIIADFKEYFLKPNESLSVRLILPEGYFENNNVKWIISIVIIIFIFIISVIIYFIVKKNKRIRK